MKNIDPPRKPKFHTSRLLEEAKARPAETAQAESPAQSEDLLLEELRTHEIDLEMQNEALRQSRVALEESRDRYARLFDYAPVGYLTLTDNGFIEQINLTGATFLGMDRSRLLSRRFADFVTTKDRARWSRRFHAALRSQENYADELMLLRDDGREFRVLIDCRPTAIDDMDSSVLLTLTSNNERRSMKQRERSFNVIFERSSIGIAVTGRDRRYRQVNPAMCRMLGYSEAELLGLSYLDITHPDDRKLNTGNIESMIVGDVSHFSTEKRYIKKTGETVWVSLNVSAVTREGSDELLYSIVMAENITARHEAEVKRLADTRLQRETLVREVHHRIKNNLQGVAGLLQRELGKFLELNPRLEAAISQVHAIATVHGLQGEDANEAVCLGESARSICSSVSSLAQRPVLFHIEHEDNSYQPMQIDSIEAVPVALVLNELILNAVKHSPDDGTPLTVSLSTDGTNALLVVRNALATTPNFNIDTGDGLGTGLRLVRSLLPDKGSQLEYELNTEHFMLTRLKLTHPVVMAARQNESD